MPHSTAVPHRAAVGARAGRGGGVRQPAPAPPPRTGGGRTRGGQYGELVERGLNPWVVGGSAGQRRVSPSVVFPAPRKPVMIVTGVLSLSVILSQTVAGGAWDNWGDDS